MSAKSKTNVPAVQTSKVTQLKAARRRRVDIFEC